jgi:D-alanyl-D-alanine carboxypeptidase/D-alanyl-D-alanine-endopeptidase (penicillin-binding protein 4)
MRMSRLVLALVALLALIAAPAEAAGLSATTRVLNREMARAGAYSGAYVVDLDTNRVLYASKPDTPRMPASVNKLYTASTALLLYGAQAHLTTNVLAPALPDATGTIQGNLVLRGGGDPTFDKAALGSLATRLVNGGLTHLEGRILGDDSAFDAFRGVPSSHYALTSDVGPLSALSYDHGVTGKRRPFWQANPAQFTADALTKALKARGVKIDAKARAGRASTGMTPLATWDSPTIASILQQMLPPSDNYDAEMLAKDLGASFGAAGSTAAGTAVVRSTIARFGIAPTIVDGSGLSRQDRTSPRQVVRLLSGMAATDQGTALDDALAVAGRTGTVYNRMRGTAAQDNCHLKTGTLHDVSSLAGYCTTQGGDRVAFAFLMNYVYPLAAHVLQDKMTVALARYTG